MSLTRLRKTRYRLERFLDVVFGYYHIEDKKDRRGPGGLVFVGPMGPRTSPSNPRGFRTWLWAWGEPEGYEVTVLGHSLYFSTVDRTLRAFFVLTLAPLLVCGLLAAAVLVVI
jgi:hypothetical protein